jgi:hypothetical protein
VAGARAGHGLRLPAGGARRHDARRRGRDPHGDAADHGARPRDQRRHGDHPHDRPDAGRRAARRRQGPVRSVRASRSPWTPGGGLFGVRRDANWEVVAQRPPPGELLEQGSTLRVDIVRR